MRAHSAYTHTYTFLLNFSHTQKTDRRLTNHMFNFIVELKQNKEKKRKNKHQKNIVFILDSFRPIYTNDRNGRESTNRKQERQELEHLVYMNLSLQMERSDNWNETK